MTSITILAIILAGCTADTTPPMPTDAADGGPVFAAPDVDAGPLAPRDYVVGDLSAIYTVEDFCEEYVFCHGFADQCYGWFAPGWDWRLSHTCQATTGGSCLWVDCYAESMP